MHGSTYLHLHAHPHRSSCTQVARTAHGMTITRSEYPQINLFLRVVRRREDGFHDLASLFHVIDLGDNMTFAVRPNAHEDKLSCNMEGVPTDASNLVIKVGVMSQCDVE
jgi:4-diphosphocytidyl-2C-methyl-D-erythritol kinase